MATRSGRCSLTSARARRGVAASLGGERFAKADLDRATARSTGALAQSLTRLVADNLIYRDDHGVYAYTASMFGDFMRPRHQRRDDDR